MFTLLTHESWTGVSSLETSELDVSPLQFVQAWYCLPYPSSVKSVHLHYLSSKILSFWGTKKFSNTWPVSDRDLILWISLFETFLMMCRPLKYIHNISIILKEFLPNYWLPLTVGLQVIRMGDIEGNLHAVEDSTHRRQETWPLGVWSSDLVRVRYSTQHKCMYCWSLCCVTTQFSFLPLCGTCVVHTFVLEVWIRYEGLSSVPHNQCFNSDDLSTWITTSIQTSSSSVNYSDDNKDRDIV